MPCIHCKGSHDEANCPVFARKQAYNRISSIGEDFQGKSPAPFIGRYGYPKINVGLLSVPEIRDDAWLYDAPKHWARKDYDINSVVSLRSSLLNTRFKADIKQGHKWLDIVKEVAMADKPADVEVEMKEKPRFSLITDPYSPPTGALAELEAVELASNPSIPGRIETAVSDTDLKASDAVVNLYEHGFDENKLTQLLSVGNLGLGKNRKLVPTRWSITATDDTIGKHLLKEVRDFGISSDYSVHYGSYLGNHYFVLLFPKAWMYELFEIYAPASRQTLQYTTDFEPFPGRKNYAEQCAGGYYTVRLALAEKLREDKQQSSCLVIRFITEEYTVPLGVWVTREATRKALANNPVSFASKELMLSYIRQLALNKFGVKLNDIFASSKLLKHLKQRSLADF